MPTLTLMPTGESPETPSQFVEDCPNEFHVIVHNGEAAIVSFRGRFLEGLDDNTNDFAELLSDDVSWSQSPDGNYIVEGHVATHQLNEGTGSEVDWYLDNIRAPTIEEWERYCQGDDVWDPETTINPDFVDFAIQHDEVRALLDAGKDWMAWRRGVEIDLCREEATLVHQLLTLMDESDDGPRTTDQAG